MPCFKGLAVSIHTNNGASSEYSIQRNSRLSRIACFIPVPTPNPPDPITGISEPANFALSITLLTPGQHVPYSTPRPTPQDPNPSPILVGESSSAGDGMVAPYRPLTNSPNETIAAYIYFDGRQKEEVATLLRRGEETWVNSRWVSVPESEGGGLAEREFIFREVGLESWLNGLDLTGNDQAGLHQTIEKRRQKLEKRRQKRSGLQGANGASSGGKLSRDDAALRYGGDDEKPVADVIESSSDSDSDDDPIPESRGQIKVVLFRVQASGEVKRGEYSPQFDAHDDDDENDNGDNQRHDGDIDHTTSFAKPKSLDPSTITTQTVTGIGPPDQPYATFTFMYRGARQLQKMGVLPSSINKNTAPAPKKSTLGDLSKISSSKSAHASSKKASKARKRGQNLEDSDSDDDNDSLMGDDEYDDKVISIDENKLNDADSNELSEGLRKIKLKRQHSADDLGGSGEMREKSLKAAGLLSPSTASRAKSVSPNRQSSEDMSDTTGSTNSDPRTGSPVKRQRASASKNAQTDSSTSESAFTMPSDDTSMPQKISPESLSGPPPPPSTAASTAPPTLTTSHFDDDDEEL